MEANILIKNEISEIGTSEKKVFDQSPHIYAKRLAFLRGELYKLNKGNDVATHSMNRADRFMEFRLKRAIQKVYDLRNRGRCAELEAKRKERFKIYEAIGEGFGLMPNGVEVNVKLPI